MGKSEPKPDTKRKFIRCEVSPEQHEAIRKLAQADQRSIAVWAQRVIVAAIPASMQAGPVATTSSSAPAAPAATPPRAVAAVPSEPVSHREPFPEYDDAAQVYVNGNHVGSVPMRADGRVWSDVTPSLEAASKRSGFSVEVLGAALKDVRAVSGTVRVTV